MLVEFTNTATEDLRAIAFHIARDNVPRAKSFARELKTACRELGDKPFRYERFLGFKNTRRRPYGNYLIIYRIEDTKVSILHIVHGAQDLGSLQLPDN